MGLLGQAERAGPVWDLLSGLWLARTTGFLVERRVARIQAPWWRARLNATYAPDH